MGDVSVPPFSCFCVGGWWLTGQNRDEHRLSLYVLYLAYLKDWVKWLEHERAVGLRENIVHGGLDHVFDLHDQAFIVQVIERHHLNGNPNVN